MTVPAQPAPSPRQTAAEKRLAQEKGWLRDMPRYCFAEPMPKSDFVWSFRISGFHGTVYQVPVVFYLVPVVFYFVSS